MKKSYELELEDLDRQSPNDPIWVLNTTGDSSVGQQGDITIAISRLNGSGKDLLRIPKTWLPIAVTRGLTRRQLMESSEFRAAVYKKHITPIKEEYAKKLRNQEGAREEEERLEDRKRQVSQATAARGITHNKNVSLTVGSEDEEDTQDNSSRTNINDIDEGGDQDTRTKIEAGVEKTAEGLSPSFKMWADKTARMPDIQASNELRSRAKFSRKELVYLQGITTNLPKVQAKIAKALGK